MTLTELKYIVALAREKNFNRAAGKCFVSQPTLSIAIKKLEDQLGVAIFERNKNNVSVTNVGQQIVQQAQKVIEEADKIKFIAKQGKDQLKDILRIGAIQTVGPYLFPQLIQRISKLAPDLPLIIEENITANLTEKLINGDLDVALVALPYQRPGIITVPVYREAFEIIISRHHEWKDKKEIHPNDFTGQTVLLLGEGHCFRNQVLASCPRCELPDEAKNATEKMLEGSSLETIRYMVASGVGISVMPMLAMHNVNEKNSGVIVKPFAAPVPHRDIVIAYRESFPRLEAIKLLMQAIHQCNLEEATWLTPKEK